MPTSDGIDYAGMQQVVRDLLTANGQTMYIRRLIAGSYDPVQQVDSGDRTQDLPTIGVITVNESSYKPTARGLAGVFSTDDIKVGDHTAILGPDVEPFLNDLLVFQGQAWQILDVNQKNPAGIPLAYILSVRK